MKKILQTSFLALCLGILSLTTGYPPTQAWADITFTSAAGVGSTGQRFSNGIVINSGVAPISSGLCLLTGASGATESFGACTGGVGVGTVTNVALSSSTSGVSASCINGSTNAACTINLSGNIPITAQSAVVASSTPYSGLTGTIPTWNQNTSGSSSSVSTILPAQSFYANSSSVSAVPVAASNIGAVCANTGVCYCDDGGTQDALTCSIPSITTLYDGMDISVGTLYANATTTPTLSINGGAALPIVKFNGIPLVAGDMPGSHAQLMFQYSSYNGGQWSLLTPAFAGLAGVLPLNVGGTGQTTDVAAFTALAADGGTIGGLLTMLPNGDQTVSSGTDQSKWRCGGFTAASGVFASLLAGMGSTGDWPHSYCTHNVAINAAGTLSAPDDATAMSYVRMFGTDQQWTADFVAPASSVVAFNANPTYKRNIATGAAIFGGNIVSPSLLVGWGYSQSFAMSSIVRSSAGAITSANITWPDGASGVYTALVLSTSFPGATDSWHATYVGSPNHTITQPTVTRDGSGAITTQPAITIH